MGWSLGYDESWKRYIGYGVIAWCDHPGCINKIDRGLAYVCGGEPYGREEGCGLYFCGEHLYFYENKEYFVCKKCGQNRKSFKPKEEHPEWIMHLITDDSWHEWRLKNKETLNIWKQQFYL